LRRFLKYTLRTLAVLAGIVILLFIVLSVYIAVNKKTIIKEITDEIGKKINGKVSIGSVNISFLGTFPEASLALHDVRVTDTMFEKHHHPFFKAEDVYLGSNITQLIRQNIVVTTIKVDRGAVYLYTDASGYTNAYLLKPKSNPVPPGGKGNTPPKNLLKLVILSEVSVTVDDQKQKHLYDGVVNNMRVKLDDKAGETIFGMKVALLVHSVDFFIPNGTFLQEKTFEGNFDCILDKKRQQLRFDSIDIKIGDHRFNLTASFDLVPPNPQFSLRIHTRKISYEFAKSLLTKKIATALSFATVDEPVDADANIVGGLSGGDPLVRVYWKMAHTRLHTPFLDFEDASLTGSYTNEVQAGLPRKDPNSKIELSNFSAKWKGLPVASNGISFVNLSKPLLACDLNSGFPLVKLNELIGGNAIELRSGDGTIDVTYRGPIEKNNNTNSFVNGTVSFINGSVLFVTRKVELKNVNGKLQFKNSDIFVDNLRCEVFHNQLILNGAARNLVTLINTQPDRVVMNWQIYSPSLNLASFIYLLKQRPGSSGAAPVASERKSPELASGVDNVLSKGVLHVKLTTPDLVYKKFEASNVAADVTLAQNRYQINEVSMDHSGGHIQLNGSLNTSLDDQHAAQVVATVQNVDVNKIFTAFDNFGQTGIKAENLEGRLSAAVTAALSLDDAGKINPGSVHSSVDFSLVNGALNDFEPVKKIQSFVFKGRDFENIRFAELKDHLDINGPDITIHKMEIQSNVLSMFVEGVYSMNGKSNLSIQVPLSNLKKRHADYIPQNRGVESNAGLSLYFRGTPGPDGKIQFKPEILRLFHKSKDKS